MFAAFAQLPDPAFRDVLLRALGLTIALFVLIGMAAGYGLSLVPDLPWAWLGLIIDWLAGAGLLAASVFLLLPVATVFGGLFMDRVADAVEAWHYTDKPPAMGQTLAEGLLTGLSFFRGDGRAQSACPAALYPVSAGDLVAERLADRPGVFRVAAQRRHPPREVKALRWANRLCLLAAGIPQALLMSVPVVNFVAPVFATAVMVHVYWWVKGRDEIETQPSSRT